MKHRSSRQSSVFQKFEKKELYPGYLRISRKGEIDLTALSGISRSFCLVPASERRDWTGLYTAGFFIAVDLEYESSRVFNG
jgi:hypothetical protein